jgi:hypothetical protein
VSQRWEYGSPAGSVKLDRDAGSRFPPRAVPALHPRSDMSAETVERIDPQAARVHLASSNALLVCAYDSAEKCQANRIGDAIPFTTLEAKAASLPSSQEIIFYCA